MAMAGALISAMGLSPQFEARTRCGDLKRLAAIGGGTPANKPLCHSSSALCSAWQAPIPLLVQTLSKQP